MTSQERQEEFMAISEETLEKYYIVADFQKSDYYLIFTIGIVPFVIATLWYNLLV